MSADEQDFEYIVVETLEDARGANGEQLTSYRVFNQRTKSWPRLARGRIIQDRYSARDHAKQVADKLNVSP